MVRVMVGALWGATHMAPEEVVLEVTHSTRELGAVIVQRTSLLTQLVSCGAAHPATTEHTTVQGGGEGTECNLTYHS